MRADSSGLPDGLWINVGSGPRVSEGWMCLDGSWQAWLAGGSVGAALARIVTGRPVGHWDQGIVCRDVRKGLGVGDGTAAVIFSSHIIEHLHRQEALDLLRDCHRALAPGGICRVVTPDLEALVHAYLGARRDGAGARAGDQLQGAALLHPPAPAGGRGPLAVYRRLTNFDSHKWLYDTDGLCALFREAGFAAPHGSGFLESRIPRGRLAEVEQRDRVLDGAGICVEAVRE